MGEADSKKSFSPDKTTLLFTLVTGFVTSTSYLKRGIVSKKFLILTKESCDNPSKNSFISCGVLSFAGYILSPSYIWSTHYVRTSNICSVVGFSIVPDFNTFIVGYLSTTPKFLFSSTTSLFVCLSSTSTSTFVKSTSTSA